MINKNHMRQGEISTIAIVNNLSAFSRKFLFSCILFITIQRSHYLQLPSSSSLESLRRRDILQIQSKRINRQIKEQSWAATLSGFGVLYFRDAEPDHVSISDKNNSYPSRNCKRRFKQKIYMKSINCSDPRILLNIEW